MDNIQKQKNSKNNQLTEIDKKEQIYYMLSSSHLKEFDRLIVGFQNLFLDLFSNHECTVEKRNCFKDQ